MSRITETFARLRQERKHALIPFIVAGDPDLRTSVELIVELAQAGASLIELGIPFSDPVADGPVIQRASMRALENCPGVAEALEVLAKARRQTEVPIILFSYFNPLLKFGIEQLCVEARGAGADGVLVTDLPAEEGRDFAARLARAGMHSIFLVAPTTTDARLQMIAERASGFIYAVSRAGVTGARPEPSNEAELLVNRVRKVSDLPVAVGFGVSTAAQVAQVFKYADAAVVGSALVAEIEKSAGSQDIVKRIGEFTRALLPKGFEQ